MTRTRHLLLGLLALVPGPLAAQGAINPMVAPHAADLARAGERGAAKTYLGQYLARSSDDPKAWHVPGHLGDPDAAILLDFAATSFDQTIRLQEDSGAVLRGYVQAGRDLLLIEDLGWDGARSARTRGGIDLPAPVIELGL